MNACFKSNRFKNTMNILKLFDIGNIDYLKSMIPNQDLLGGTDETIFYLNKLKWKDKLKHIFCDSIIVIQSTSSKDNRYLFSLYITKKLLPSKVCATRSLHTFIGTLFSWNSGIADILSFEIAGESPISGPATRY